MRIGNWRAVLAAGAVSLGLCAGLTGCGENVIPEMTEGERQAIGEYAAITLMKYDAGNRSRLVTLLPEEILALEAVAQPPAQESPAEVEEPSDSAAEPAGDAPVEEVPQQESMEGVLGLAEGVSVSYVEAVLCDTYPETAELGFTISATGGRKLLVLRFRFDNGAAQEQLIDLAAQKELSFRVAVNGGHRQNTLISPLLDDMAVFKESVEPGGSVEAVLIIETEYTSMEELTSISLSLKNGEKSHTAQLR